MGTRAQQWGTPKHQQEVQWLMAYALGLAFSEPSDAAACAQILAVTADYGLLAEARARLPAVIVADPDSRRRAQQLLNRAARSVPSPVQVGSLAVRQR